MEAAQVETFVPLNDVRKFKKQSSMGSNSDVSIASKGEEDTLEYRMQAQTDGKKISLWHDVSLVHIDQPQIYILQYYRNPFLELCLRNPQVYQVCYVGRGVAFGRPSATSVFDVLPFPPIPDNDLLTSMMLCSSCYMITERSTKLPLMRWATQSSKILRRASFVR